MKYRVWKQELKLFGTWLKIGMLCIDVYLIGLVSLGSIAMVFSKNSKTIPWSSIITTYLVTIVWTIITYIICKTKLRSVPFISKYVKSSRLKESIESEEFYEVDGKPTKYFAESVHWYKVNQCFIAKNSVVGCKLGTYKNHCSGILFDFIDGSYLYLQMKTDSDRIREIYRILYQECCANSILRNIRVGKKRKKVCKHFFHKQRKKGYDVFNIIQENQDYIKEMELYVTETFGKESVRR